MRISVLFQVLDRTRFRRDGMIYQSGNAVMAQPVLFRSLV